MTNNIPQNTVELADKYGEKINSALEQLAAKVGVGVDHFWPIVVEQQRMEGIFLASCWLLMGILIFFLLRKSSKMPQELFGEKDFTKKEAYFIIACILSFFFLFIPLLIDGYVVFTKIVNPEYHALERVAKMIK